MKHKLINAVRKSFRTALARALPDFSPVCEPVGPHCDLYLYEPKPGLRWYLLLEPDLFEDCFHIEVASTPYNSLPPCHSPSLPSQPTSDEDLRFRITALWAPRDPYAAWWLGHPLGDATSPSILPGGDEGHVVRAVPHQVEDCITQIRERVLPYLRQTLTNHRSSASVHREPIHPFGEPAQAPATFGPQFVNTITSVLPFTVRKSQTERASVQRERA